MVSPTVLMVSPHRTSPTVLDIIFSTEYSLQYCTNVPKVENVIQRKDEVKYGKSRKKFQRKRNSSRVINVEIKMRKQIKNSPETRGMVTVVDDLQHDDIDRLENRICVSQLRHATIIQGVQ